MKRIATLVVILLMSLTASAHSIRYFTYSQASRTVNYLNAQNEMMIYCGYDYEIETYVLINEVWMERVNSAYYELWVFGYDAYTGEEIYMPLDLGCVWLFSAGRIYNAAQYLRFHATVRTPNITWYVPSYNPYTRMMHRPGYARTYHYDVHRYGWMPPAYHHGHGNHPPMHPYYMRQPNEPAPRPNNTWTPGVDRPVVTTPSTSGRSGSGGRVTTGSTTTGSATGSSGTRTGNTTTTSSGRGGTTTNTTGTSPRGANTTGTPAGTNPRGTTATGTSGRGNGTTATGTATGSSRGTTSTTPTRSSATGSSSSPRSSAATTTTEESPRSSAKPTTSSRGNKPATTSGTTSSPRGNSGTTSSSGRGGNTTNPRGTTSTR